MVSDGCRQDREVLQSGLHRLVNRPIALVGAVAVGGAQSLQLRQVTVEVLVAYLLLRSARGVRYSHLLQQSDHVVTQWLIVLGQIIVALRYRCGFLQKRNDAVISRFLSMLIERYLRKRYFDSDHTRVREVNKKLIAKWERINYFIYLLQFR